MIHAINYDLNKSGQDYVEVHETIKANATGGWAHVQGSVWLVDTTMTCGQWRDLLKAVTDRNDEILVVRLEGGWATANTDASVTDWLKSGARNW